MDLTPHINPDGATKGSILLFVSAWFSHYLEGVTKQDIFLDLSILSLCLVIFINIPKAAEVCYKYYLQIKNLFKK